MALITEMRPTELFKLQISQFKMVRQGEGTIWRIQGLIGIADGTAKTMKGRFKAVKIKRKQVYVWDEDMMDGRVNMFQDISEYLEIRSGLNINEADKDCFFASINPRGTSLKTFYRSQVLGEHTVRKSIQNACELNDVIGLGDKKGIVTHTLRGTVATLLLEAGRADSSIMNRTGHKQAPSILYYQNLAGKEGKLQNNILFAGPNKQDSDQDEVLKRELQSDTEAVIDDKKVTKYLPVDDNTTLLIDQASPSAGSSWSDIPSSVFGSISGPKIKITINYSK